MASPLPVTGTLPESWHVRLPIFEGPLDLLLELIRLHEVEIVDIPVAPICDQFHEYLHLMEILDLDIAGDYIYMASYLIHLKSKLLLPKPKTVEGKEIDEDPRQDLVERLLEYRKLKEAAQSLAEVDSQRRGMWPRRTDELRRITADDEREMDLSELSLFDLLKTFRDVLDRFEREHPEPLRMAGESFSVRDQIQRLLSAVSADRPTSLFDDLASLSGRREAIAAFLAVLEMARMQLLRLHQSAKGAVLLYRTEREVQQAELEAVQA
ncbi:MAG: segregation/condensation protein A [Thermoanaerobaculia bacterium]|nr:segregation/condensation protein A [Thermoanaerobaculia bacterium]